MWMENVSNFHCLRHLKNIPLFNIKFETGAAGAPKKVIVEKRLQASRQKFP
jgi:hypothetical protein